MLDNETKRRIDSARDILVGKIPDPKAQVEQITTALIYKFMDDMDGDSVELGGKARFFTGAFEKFAWAKLLDSRLGGADRLNLYVEAITRMSQNPNLPQLFRDIFKDAFLPYRDPETLNLFLKEINGFSYDHSERLGDAFEYLLSVLGSQGAAGQFRTPRHIIDFIVEIVAPQKDETLLDPACGTAGFLISSYKRILKQNMKAQPGDKLNPDEKAKLMANLTGYDISPDMTRLSRVNMYLHGFPNPKIYEYDTLTSEDRWDENYDVILANPPFMTPKGGIRPHKRFSVRANRSEVLFVDYIAEHLNAGGRAGVIVPEGIIFQSGNAYKQLRKMLVDEGFLWAVVSLPAGVFNPYSGVKTSILLMGKTLAKHTKDILFVKIQNDGFDLGAQRREIDKNDLHPALQEIENYKFSILNDSKPTVKNLKFNIQNLKLSHLVPKEKIAASGDYNLSGDRYKEVVTHGKQKWPMVELADICKIQSGGTPSKNVKEYYENGKVPWLRSEVCKNRSVYEATEFLTESGLKNSSAKLLNPKTTLIALVGATIGKTAFLTFQAAVNQNIAGLYPLNENQLLPEYLFIAAQTLYNEFIALGDGKFKMANLSFVKSLKIPLPPLEVQKELVAELETCQKIIDGARQVVANWKPKIEIAPDWSLTELDKVCTQITDGTHKTPTYTNEGIPFLRVTDLTKSNESKKFISETEHKELIKRCKPEKGDVLYSKNGTIGVAKLVEWDWEFSIFVSLALLKPNRGKLYPKYLETFLNTPDALSQAKSFSKSGTVTNLHLIEIKKLKIPIPPLQTQKQIVAQIEEEQKLIAANKKLIEIYEQKIKDKIADVWGG